MIHKIFILVFFGVMLYALGVALFALLKVDWRPDAKTKKLDRATRDRLMAKALTWRVVLALTIFALLIGGYYVGLFEPHGLYAA